MPEMKGNDIYSLLVKPI